MQSAIAKCFHVDTYIFLKGRFFLYICDSYLATYVI